MNEIRIRMFHTFRGLSSDDFMSMHIIQRFKDMR